ncbi:Nn.00g087530.m01.CDS01 [Neocucurbitaria sp. VM-36]
MDAPTFIDTFTALPTNEERRKALEALVSQLTPYEWRLLHNLTSARSFQFDIIGQLPVELVAHIFSYLDTSTPYRLQRVSRRCNHLLRSPHVLKKSLNHWYAGKVNLQSANHALCEQTARTIHRFRNGKPSSILQVSSTMHVYDLSLVGDILIWLAPQDDRSVSLLNLSTWNLCTVSGDARERLKKFVASDQIVALATFSTVVYVMTLHGEGRKTFRVPSFGCLQAFTCRERTVACAESFHDRISVCIWDYDTQRATSFQITRDPSHLFFASGIYCHHKYHSLALLLQPDTNSILVFTMRCQCSKMPDPIVYGRFSYHGECINSSYAPPLSKLDHVLSKDLCGFDPVDEKVFALKVFVKIQGTRQGYIYLQFDERLNRFTEVDDPASKGSLWIDATTLWWKDTYYSLSLITRGSSETGMMLAHEGTRYV